MSDNLFDTPPPAEGVSEKRQASQPADVIPFGQDGSTETPAAAFPPAHVIECESCGDRVDYETFKKRGCPRCDASDASPDLMALVLMPFLGGAVSALLMLSGCADGRAIHSEEELRELLTRRKPSAAAQDEAWGDRLPPPKSEQIQIPTGHGRSEDPVQ